MSPAHTTEPRPPRKQVLKYALVTLWWVRPRVHFRPASICGAGALIRYKMRGIGLGDTSSHVATSAILVDNLGPTKTVPKPLFAKPAVP